MLTIACHCPPQYSHQQTVYDLEAWNEQSLEKLFSQGSMERVSEHACGVCRKVGFIIDIDIPKDTWLLVMEHKNAPNSKNIFDLPLYFHFKGIEFQKRYISIAKEYKNTNYSHLVSVQVVNHHYGYHDGMLGQFKCQIMDLFSHATRGQFRFPEQLPKYNPNYTYSVQRTIYVRNPTLEHGGSQWCDKYELWTDQMLIPGASSQHSSDVIMVDPPQQPQQPQVVVQPPPQPQQPQVVVQPQPSQPEVLELYEPPFVSFARAFHQLPPYNIPEAAPDTFMDFHHRQ